MEDIEKTDGQIVSAFLSWADTLHDDWRLAAFEALTAYQCIKNDELMLRMKFHDARRRGLSEYLPSYVTA